MATVNVVLHGPAYRDGTVPSIGMLSTDSAASSYGIPVLVDRDGHNPRGPADLPVETWLNVWYDTLDYRGSPYSDTWSAEIRLHNQQVSAHAAAQRAIVEVAIRCGYRIRTAWAM